MLERLQRSLSRPVDAASLAAFRIVFGGLVFVGTIRLLTKGYVREAFALPTFFFPLWPFEAVLRPLPGWGMHAVYGAICLFSFSLAAGLFTRFSAVVVCILFTYAHFLDLTNYLNHYWLVTLLTALMAILPVGRTLSLDARLHPSKRRDEVPAWVLFTFRFQVGLVYFFAGLAKVKSDWLLAAQPLRTWLLANTDTPVLGVFFRQEWVAFVMSWVGAAFDITIVVWLLCRKTRPYAYCAIVVFHLLTAWLFHIGMFPFFMMASSLLFLDPDWPRRWTGSVATRRERSVTSDIRRRAPIAVLGLFAVTQILVPFRSRLYGGNVLWHEQGYRFGWNVMLMEKMGSIEFTTIEKTTRARRLVRVRDHLTPSQEKAMATQPDMILAFAKHLAKLEQQAGRDVEVHADAFVVLNARPATRFIDPAVDLAVQDEGFAPKRWVREAPR